MAENAICVDLPFLLDPYKLLIAVAGLGRKYDAIYVSNALQLIEFMGPDGPPFSLNLARGKLPHEDSFVSMLGYTPGPVSPDNMGVGLVLAARAFGEGLIQPWPVADEELVRVGLAILRARKLYPDAYRYYPRVNSSPGVRPAQTLLTSDATTAQNRQR